MGASRGYEVILNLVPAPYCSGHARIGYFGHARIGYFGHATVVEDKDSLGSDLYDLGHIPRWTAPEIWNGQSTYSKEAGIFSFAMVMVEVCHG